MTASAAVEIYSVRCAGDGARRPAGFAARLPYELCLVRRGCFRYRDRRGSVLVDPATVLLGGPDCGEYDVEHPFSGGDDDTFIRLDVSTWLAVAGDDLELPVCAPVTPAVELLHRQLLAVRARRPDGPAVEETAVQLTAAVVAAVDPARAAGGRLRSSWAGRRRVDDARAALVANPDLTLVQLAALVGCAPHHLSRLFGRELGVGVAEFRLSLRAQQALDGLVAGAPSLAELASACGFTDHAHLTRTLRHRFGVTPSTLRHQWTSPR